MASRQTDKYGNPAHHTGHLGAPGTTGAFETHDPLGAPGTTGASPTTGYNGQEQLHRPAAGLNTTGTTGQGYAYGTAATMGHLGHAQVAAPHTASLTATYDTGGAGQGTHKTGGYDTGSFGSGADIGHIGHEGRHGGGYDTSVDKGRGGGYDILGKGVGGAHGGGYDTGGDKGRVGGPDTLGQGVGGAHGGSYDTGGRETHGQGLGEGHIAGGYEAGSDWARTQGVKEHGGGYDTGGKKDQGQGVKEHSASGYDTGGDWTHSQEVREHGGKYDIGGDKTRERVERHTGGYDNLTGTGDQVHGGITATVVEVVTEEPMQEEESKGFIDRIMEHLPGTGGGTK